VNGRGRNGLGLLASWADLEPAVPQMVDTMRRYLTQIGCVLRPGSVVNADIALRCFAGFLVQTAPQVTGIAQVTRRHIEDYKPWLAERPGQHQPRVSTATIAHRLLVTNSTRIMAPPSATCSPTGGPAAAAVRGGRSLRTWATSPNAVA